MDGIQVAIGVSDETHGEPMAFSLFDNGVNFAADYTNTDLTISVAVLRDLADALEYRVKMMSN